MLQFPVLDRASLAEQTKSRCPVCNKSVPAEVFTTDTEPAKVMMRRFCHEHGVTESCISPDARFYRFMAEQQSGCCGTSPHATFSEQLSTCVALIEIMDSCNLTCPTCFASSPLGKDKVVPLDQIVSRIEGIVDRKGGIEILQLSGGEPTIHPDFYRLMEWAVTHPKIDYVLVNTNGVRIARDDTFLDELETLHKLGDFQVYLQFDGLQEAGQKELRGADLRSLKQRAIERLGVIQVPVTLAVTVVPENLPHLWDIIEFGIPQRHVHGVSLQPVFLSGRVGAHKHGSGDRDDPITVADIVHALHGQSQGELRFNDWTPLPCGNANCHWITFFCRPAGEPRTPIGDIVDFTQVEFPPEMRNRANPLHPFPEAVQCGCDTTPLGQLLKEYLHEDADVFRIFIKPFMDARSWDERRIANCCTHVIRPDGSLDSFCRYYAS